MSEVSPQPRRDQPRLIPALGIFSATMLVAGGVIGSGIFRKPGVMAAQVGSPELLLGVWLLAGVVSGSPHPTSIAPSLLLLVWACPRSHASCNRWNSGTPEPPTSCFPSWMRNSENWLGTRWPR